MELRIWNSQCIPSYRHGAERPLQVMRCLRESGLYAPSFLSPRTYTFVFQDFTSTPSREVAAHESHSRVTTENDVPSREAHARNGTILNLYLEALLT